MSEVRRIREFDEASAGWPPKGVRLVCSVPACGEVALETGLCVKHQAQLVRLLADEFGGLVAASFAEVRWYAAQLGWNATPDQGIALKRAVVSAYSPVTALECDSDRALRDYARGDVKDAPANRERRAALFSALPDRIHARQRQRGNDYVVVLFVLGLLAGVVITLGFLFGI